MKNKNKITKGLEEYSLSENVASYVVQCRFPRTLPLTGYRRDHSGFDSSDKVFLLVFPVFSQRFRHVSWYLQE